MKNWSGNQHWHPSRVARPANEQEIVALVRQALQEGRKLRPVGSAHSFMPLSATDDILLDLKRMSGIDTEYSSEDGTCVRAQAGTTLRDLNELLAARGLALENMGDIDVQTIAGAISTGTHGTGLTFGNLSTQVVALRLVNGRGQLVVCSKNENPELLRAARLGLGLLGIITEITLRCVPAYHLELLTERQPFAEVVNDYRSLSDGCRHFEAYWFPHTPWMMTKRLSVVPGIPHRRAGPAEGYRRLGSSRSYRAPDGR